MDLVRGEGVEPRLQRVAVVRVARVPHDWLSVVFETKGEVVPRFVHGAGLADSRDGDVRPKLYRTHADHFRSM